MRFKNFLSASLAALFLIFSFSSCSDKGGEGDVIGDEQSKGQTYTLTVWGSQEDQEMLKKMCDEYAAANPNNTYNFLFGIQGENEVADKILNDVQNGPDVYSFASDQINKLYAGGALARVGGDIEKNVKEINSSGSVDAASLKISGQDQLFAYPCTGDNCCFVYYDKRVYTDPSMLSSLDSMLTAAEAAGKKVHFRLNDDGWYLSSFFFAVPELKYDVTYNENMVEQTVDINFNNASGLDVMKSLRTYIYRDGLVSQTDDSKMIAAFTPDSSGKTEAAAVINGTWNAANIKKLLGDNMGVCKLPTVDIGGAQVQLSGFMGYKLIGVNGYSKNKGEAHKLAQWLTNEENQLTRYRTRGFGPTNKKVSENEAVTSDTVMTAVLQQAQFNRVQKSVPTAYWTPMASLITPIINAKAEGKTVSDEQLQQQLNAAVEQIGK